jgi:hypothetical protein
MSVEQMVKDLVLYDGSGEESDADLIRAQLQLLPRALLTSLSTDGIKIVACRESVVDYRSDLITKTPRGWPAGVSWSSVPGCYLPDERKVAIATVLWNGVRQIPPCGVKHGSFNLVLHEVMHADDYSADRLRSHNGDFLAAREIDKAALTDYQRQDGAAGFEESYAETAARHFGADASFAVNCGTLSQFWSNTSFPVPPGRMARAAVHGPGYVGTARLLDDGAIELDLRADEDDVIVGAHALLRVAPGSIAHAQVSNRRRRGATGVMLLEAF